MAPKIHLVRHAQGLHNVDPSYTRFHDPLLTPRGKQQCAELQKNFPHHQVVDLIVSSPIRRTIYTALLGFKDDIKTKGLQIVALPELQETSDLPCDTGSEPLELANEFAGEPIDFSLVQPDWTNKKLPKWAFNDEAIEKRAQEAREWLLQRPEKEIVVVTHGSFRSYLIILLSW
jgi:broad specificity phosphatase PhoE